jgi:Tfp pilus assembly protein PilV
LSATVESRARLRRQGGFSGAVVIIAVILIGVALLLARGLSRTEGSVQGERSTRLALDRVAEALNAFAVANARLPCPADGASDTGDAAPTSAAATCTAPAGTVPWKAIGLRREDSVDGWGRKISYRVYSGNTGFTQANGASATECNSDLATPLQSFLQAGGKCGAAHWNTYAQFKAGKGLTVTDQGTNKTQIAFVLISHGETGYGAWGAEGGARLQMPTAGGNELANTGSASPFFAGSHSAAGVPASAAAHFDDIVVYRTIDELVSSSKLVARAHGTNAGTVAGGVFDRATLTAAGVTPSNNMGTNTITVNGVQIVSIVPAGRNVSFGEVDLNSDGVIDGAGLGAIESGSGLPASVPLSSVAGDSLGFLLPPTPLARSIGISLVDYGTSGGATDFERVEFFFFRDNLSTQVDGPITKVACRSGAVQANYTITATGDFNIFGLRPIASVGGNETTLLVGSFRACDASVAAGQCKAPTAVAANDCP